jgi:hypothetical protein
MSNRSTASEEHAPAPAARGERAKRVEPQRAGVGPRAPKEEAEELDV